jgi:hypothetical protein
MLRVKLIKTFFTANSLRTTSRTSQRTSPTINILGRRGIQAYTHQEVERLMIAKPLEHGKLGHFQKKTCSHHTSRCLHQKLRYTNICSFFRSQASNDMRRPNPTETFLAEHFGFSTASNFCIYTHSTYPSEPQLENDVICVFLSQRNLIVSWTTLRGPALPFYE